MNNLYIPLSIKNYIWSILYGETSLYGNCLSCNHTILRDTFQCGLYVSINKGGTIDANNLVPLCNNCYSILNNRGVSEIAPHINIASYIQSKNQLITDPSPMDIS